MLSESRPGNSKPALTAAVKLSWDSGMRDSRFFSLYYGKYEDIPIDVRTEFKGLTPAQVRAQKEGVE